MSALREFAEIIICVSYCTVINGDEGEIRPLARLGEVKMRSVTRDGEEQSTKQVRSICPVGRWFLLSVRR